MKFVRFILREDVYKNERLGILTEEGVVDLQSAYKNWLELNKNCSAKSARTISEIIFSDDLVNFLNYGDLSLEYTRIILEDKFLCEKFSFSEDKIILLAPITNPPGIRDFISFEEHIKNTRKKRNLEVPPKWYEIPAYYKGSTATIKGPDENIIWPNYTRKLDYELEIACIIGKKAESISREQAGEYIFGYTIMNDFSARDIQMEEVSIGLGPAKGKDFATSLGPYIVTKDEFSNLYDLKMSAFVNGEKWSEGSTKTMFRKFDELIEYASKSEKLLPGDILGSGTVGLGCGLELDRFLKPGDVVELEIENIGKLKNKIIKT
ncbi:fumarylacetoacetate hydrolase family protein [Virgibacillus kimchii]